MEGMAATDDGDLDAMFRALADPARDGIPFASFGVEDVDAEHTRLEGLGVRFTQPPTAFGDVTTAVFDDTCGNLIQIAQK